MLNIQLAQLNIEVFHFYTDSAVAFDTPLADLCRQSCTVLSTVEKLLTTPDFPPSPPSHVVYAVMLASFSILRILKYPGVKGVDVDEATSRLFFVINLAKKLTLHNNDVFGKTSLFLTQLWNSPKAFRKEDGSGDMGVRVTDRLTMSPVLDVVWRWYDLFDEQAKAPDARKGV